MYVRGFVALYAMAIIYLCETVIVHSIIHNLIVFIQTRIYNESVTVLSKWLKYQNHTQNMHIVCVLIIHRNRYFSYVGLPHLTENTLYATASTE